jgi:hypothetical protein
LIFCRVQRKTRAKPVSHLATWRPWRLGGSNPRRRVDRKRVNRHDAEDAKKEEENDMRLSGVFISDGPPERQRANSLTGAWKS